ncbi:lipopolysaccharide biosynthesis protein [Agromyces badenianii]|uniref:lipopolysaccharide biosynthesis protein n=1 Tax=Agromyces badenianii TaxID=2080742 RepID=UPI000D5A2311|nr:lipopolysaccharide biosynthesis protein [Agromyces badenianii]PWC05169.1 lipopolysaccharide biosynthesis protein [Agromyces badenianii]
MTEPESRDSAGPAGSVGRSAATGAVWLTVQKWAVRLSGFVTIAILTRFLGPEDFGTVAAASTVLPFFYLLADLGFAAYIVQVDRTDRRMLSTAFWFSALAGALLCGVLVAVAPLFGLVFDSDEFVPVLQVMSIAVVFTAVSSVPTALLRREMRFRALAIQGTIAALVAQVVAIAMTLTGLGVWALVGQALATQLVVAVLAWFAAGWRPAFLFSRAEFITMTRFGSQVLGVEFVAMCRAWAEAAIISGVLGIAALGYLNIAQRLVQIVQDLTGAAVVPVSTVAFAKIRDFVGRLQAAYLRALRMTYALLTPPLTFIAVGAPLIIPIIFGDGWQESIPVAQVLALAGIMVVGATLDHGLFYGLGKPGRWFTYALVIDAITVTVTALTARSGLVAVAFGFLAVAVVATASRWFLVARLIQASPGMTAAPFIFPAVSVLVSGAAGWGVLTLTGELNSFVRLVLVGLTVLLVHLVVVRLLVRPVIDEVAGFLRRSRRSGTGRLRLATKEGS